MTSATTARTGQGWLAFAGILLILRGFVDIANGLWALDTNAEVVDAVVFDDNLDVWGWIYLVIGVVLVAAGIAVMGRRPWAVLVGIVVAGVALVANAFWLFSYPFASIVGIILSVMVLYGLTVYGVEEEPAG